MKKSVKVLVVDDSALYRKAIADILSECPNIEVAATAPNGSIALKKIADRPPDLITLDMHMPDMDGLSLLEQLRTYHPQIKTVVFSHNTEKSSDLTLKALSLGAVEFIAKPSTGGSLDAQMHDIRKNLLPCIVEISKAHESANGGRRRQASAARGTASKRQPIAAPRDVIAIGTSTGGPNSLLELFTQIPNTLRQTILIVQHMPPGFTKKLAAQLSRQGSVPVKEAENGEAVKPGQAYIAPGDFHMEVVKRPHGLFIETNQKPPENFCRPAVDVLFRSVADIYGKRAVGVIMTGMGQDGFKGSEAMKRNGAPIVAQDEESSIVWGMPKYIVENDLADAVAPLSKLFAAISTFILQ